MPYSINDLCIDCSACARNCPVFAIDKPDGGHYRINELRCVDCGVCGRVCAKSAIMDTSGNICIPVKRSLWPKPKIDESLCSACSICLSVCTKGALCIAAPAFNGDIDVAAELYKPNLCVGCGLCMRDCPLGAITMVEVQE